MKTLKIGIVGASVTSCILAMYFKKKGYKVLLLEKGNKTGGAWQVDKFGSIFSNIISPISNLEKKNFKKIIKFLKSFKIEFNRSPQKALFTKRIVNVQASDFRKLIYLAKKKLNIKYNYKVKNIKEKEKFVLVNNKIKFDYIFYPKNVYVSNINLIRKNKNFKINDKIESKMRSKHLRFFSYDLNLKNIMYNEEGIGPLDRLQIFNDKNNKKIVNGRIKMNWKNKTNKQILNGIKKAFGINKLVFPKFSYYHSERISKDNMVKLIENLSNSERIIFINTNSISEFVLNYFIKPKKFNL